MRVMLLRLFESISDIVNIGINNLFQSFDRIGKALAIISIVRMPRIASTISTSFSILATDREVNSFFN
jgi:hypothetical protein